MHYTIEPTVVGAKFNIFQHDPEKGKHWKQFIAELETYQKCITFIKGRIKAEQIQEADRAKESAKNREQFIEALKKAPWVAGRSKVFHEDERYQQ